MGADNLQPRRAATSTATAPPTVAAAGHAASFTSGIAPTEPDEAAAAERRRYDVYVFVADAADNSGLQLAPEQINLALRRRRQQFERLRASGKWWELAQSARAPLAPEVREVRWMAVSEALRRLDPSKPFVDEWQLGELSQCGSARREVPWVTIDILRELQRLGTPAAVRAASVEAKLEAAARRATPSTPWGSPSRRRSPRAPNNSTNDLLRPRRLASELGEALASASAPVAVGETAEMIISRRRRRRPRRPRPERRHRPRRDAAARARRRRRHRRRRRSSPEASTGRARCGAWGSSCATSRGSPSGLRSRCSRTT